MSALRPSIAIAPRLPAWSVLLLAATLLGGCAEDVTIEDPQTGAVALCQQSLQGLDPWSQTDACVAGHMAQGWVIEHP
jgi:hypothetical protein